MMRDAAYLRRQIDNIMDFYHPRAIDRENGGFFNGFRDDGSIYDPTTRHLVSTCRFIYNYSVAYRLSGRPDYREAALHGLDFLQNAHLQPGGSYAWVLNIRDVEDATRHCYGHAFVLLAVSTAAGCGIDEAKPLVASVYDLMEERFFEPEAGLYVDVIAADDWTAIDPYRGQNANMHSCEATLAAYEATGESRYLDRACLLARRICVDLAGATHDMVWEHYRSDWSPDWMYNIDDPKHLFRPFGYVPGHLVEWTKLLLLLHAVRPEDWMVTRARELFDAATDRAWEADFGSFAYTFDPEGKILDRDRYYWVVSEAIAASALLATEAGDESYWRWYDKFWDDAEARFIDHERGGWYRILHEDGKPMSDEKSPPAKTDYHPLSACLVVMQALERAGNG